jgi:hypothetical protein
LLGRLIAHIDANGVDALPALIAVAPGVRVLMLTVGRLERSAGP